jgi:hypothetical protein
LPELLAEQAVDGLAGSVLGGQEQVGVDAEGEAWIRVTEVVGDGSHGLAAIDEDRGVEVAEGVHAVGSGRLHAGDLERLLPDVRVRPVDGIGGTVEGSSSLARRVPVAIVVRRGVEALVLEGSLDLAHDPAVRRGLPKS